MSDVLQQALRYTAYQAVAGTETTFGRAAGYPTLPWDGAFVDVVLHEAGIQGAPSFVNPLMAFAVMQYRDGEINRGIPRAGDVTLTSFGKVGIVEGWNKRDGAIVVIGDNPVSGRPGMRGVLRTAVANQDLLLVGRPRGFKDSAASSPIAPSGAQMRADPERYLRGALQSHPYTKGLGPVSMSSALYRWALICGARPEDAEKRRFRDEYLVRLGLESGYFAGGLRR